jgi:integrase
MLPSELHDLDQRNPHWIIPRLRTKNKKAEHTVPLSTAAVLLIREGLEASKEGWEGQERSAGVHRSVRRRPQLGSALT